MEKITLYTNPNSRGRIIRWLLEECGADYEVVPVPFGENGTKSADYLAVNPMGKLPAVKYGDAVITEVAALITFLAELFPEKNLIPAAGTAERGEFYRWLIFALHAEYAFMDKRFGIPETPERKYSIGYGSFDEVVATLTEFLRGKEYALGGHFTACVGHYAGAGAARGWGTRGLHETPRGTSRLCQIASVGCGTRETDGLGIKAACTVQAA